MLDTIRMGCSLLTLLTYVIVLASKGECFLAPQLGIPVVTNRPPNSLSASFQRFSITTKRSFHRPLSLQMVWRSSTQSRYQPKKILPLFSGGQLIIGKDGWFISTDDNTGVGNNYGDQAIPLELGEQLAWLLYRDGVVIRTITEEEIDTLDPLLGGSYSDPMAAAKSGGFFVEALSQLVSWPWGSKAERVDVGFGSRLVDTFMNPPTQSELRAIAEEEITKISKAEIQAAAFIDKDDKLLAKDQDEDVPIFSEMPTQKLEVDIAPQQQAQVARVEEPTVKLQAEEGWRECVQEGAALKREAKMRMEVGLLQDAAKLAAASKDKFTLAAEKGYRNAVKESQAASKLAAQALQAMVAQKEAKEEATRLASEAERLLQQGELKAAMLAAAGAQDAFVRVEQNYGRVTASQIVRVVEVRVRAEEQQRLKEAQDAGKQAQADVTADARVDDTKQQAKQGKSTDSTPKKQVKTKQSVEVEQKGDREREQAARVREATVDMEDALVKAREQRQSDEETRNNEDELMLREEQLRQREEADRREKRARVLRESEEAAATASAAAKQRELEKVKAMEREAEKANAYERELEKTKREEEAAAAAKLKDEWLAKLGLEMGTKVMAKFYEDGYEYEALILSPTNPDTVNLVFVGYGNEQETLPEDVRVIAQPRASTSTSQQAEESQDVTSSAVSAVDAPPLRQPEVPPAIKPVPARPDTLVQAAAPRPSGTMLVTKGGIDGDIGEKVFELDVKYHGILLGKQGVTVRAVEQASGATVKFRKDPVGVCIIRGTKVQREQAWQLLMSVKAELPKVLTILRSSQIAKGDLKSMPDMEGKMEAKDDVWSVAVEEVMARAKDKSSD